MAYDIDAEWSKKRDELFQRQFGKNTAEALPYTMTGAKTIEEFEAINTFAPGPFGMDSPMAGFKSQYNYEKDKFYNENRPKQEASVAEEAKQVENNTISKKTEGKSRGRASTILNAGGSRGLLSAPTTSKRILLGA